MAVEQGTNDVLVIQSVTVMVVQMSVVVGLAVVLETVVLVHLVWGLLVVELELVEVLEELDDFVVDVEGTDVELVHLVVELELEVDGEVVELELELVPHLVVVDVLELDELLDETEEELEVEYSDVVEAEVVVMAVVVVLVVVVPLPQVSAYGSATEVPARAAMSNESDLCI